eukprot:XP_001708562.1 Hypothetical protein GL50803_32365 [Giardia lamblia ATCC 50803]
MYVPALRNGSVVWVTDVLVNEPFRTVDRSVITFTSVLISKTPSAGTNEPAVRHTTSPTTRLSDDSSWGLPSLTTVTVCLLAFTLACHSTLSLW